MAEGYIPLFRKILDNEIWHEKPFSKGQAWVDLLLLANHKDTKFLLGNEVFEAKKGQVVTSEQKLMERWGWSKSKVRAFLSLLECEKMAVKNSDKKKTTLTLCNYKYYSDFQNHKKTIKEPQKDPINNVNKDNKDIPPISPKGNDVKEDKFSVFWKAYPKKVGKGAAEKSFAKFNPSDTLLKTMIESVNRQKQSEQWQKENGQYIPNPATWLNQKRWEDELTVTTSPAEQPIKRKTYKTIIENGKEVNVEVDN